MYNCLNYNGIEAEASYFKFCLTVALGKRKNSEGGEYVSLETDQEREYSHKHPALAPDDAPPLLVLPATELRTRGEPSTSSDKELAQMKEENFVDVLISDLVRFLLPF